jgi:hypothetical protein
MAHVKSCFIGVAALLMCGACAHESRDEDVVPPGVVEIVVRLSPDQAEEWQHLFRWEYVLRGGEEVSSTYPGPNEPHEARLVFLGMIVPLAVRSDGEVCIPDKFSILRMPGLTEVRQWEPGRRVHIGGRGGSYHFRPRPDEEGLIFLLVPYGDVGEHCAWIYPGDLTPIALDDMQPSQRDSSEHPVPTVVIPDVSELLQIEIGGEEWTELFSEAIRLELRRL